MFNKISNSYWYQIVLGWLGLFPPALAASSPTHKQIESPSGPQNPNQKPPLDFLDKV